MRNAVMALAGLVFVALAAAAIFLALKQPEGPVSPAAVNVAGADIGGPFTLTDQTGARVTSAALIDGPTLIYFGYASCPDVCPVDVAVMASAVDLLAGQGFEVTPVFVTIDPARDTSEALAGYAEAKPQPKVPAALLDVRAVSELLGNCSTRHVYRLADAGRMPRPIKLGSLVRWRRHELESWIAAGCPHQQPGGHRS